MPESVRMFATITRQCCQMEKNKKFFIWKITNRTKFHLKIRHPRDLKSVGFSKMLDFTLLKSQCHMFRQWFAQTHRYQVFLEFPLSLRSTKHDVYIFHQLITLLNSMQQKINLKMKRNAYSIIIILMGYGASNTQQLIRE